MINLFHPFVPKDAIDAAVDVLRSKTITQGPKVEEFEKNFKDFFGLSNAVSMNSGTSAIETAIELIGIKPGDEVISTPLTCSATNIPLLRAGAKIIWADILEDTLCIDPEDVRRKLSPKTKAVMQVHLGGAIADVGKVVWSNDGLPNKIPVISDACQGLGIFNGDFTCCSFQAIKQMTTVDGGMLVCGSDQDAERARLLRWFGIDRTKKMPNTYLSYKDRKMTYDIEIAGTKRHMNDVTAAMGVVGLRYLADNQLLRRKQYFQYREKLAKFDGLKIVTSHVHQLFTVLVNRRDDFVKKLFENDIDSHVVHLRNDTYHIFGGRRADLPVMNYVEDEYLSLPIGPHVSDEDVEFICDTIKGGW